MTRVIRSGLAVDKRLANFVEETALPGTGIPSHAVWSGLATAHATIGARIREALDRRDSLQGKIDDWHRARKGQPQDAAAYRAYLTEIGYLVPDGPDFEIETTGTDPEIATISGPQLVVPVMNASYALNAANARWGSLYDALYGTDAMGDLPAGTAYDPARGARVIAWGRAFLDDVAPLASGSHSTAPRYTVVDGALQPALTDPD